MATEKPLCPHFKETEEACIAHAKEQPWHPGAGFIMDFCRRRFEECGGFIHATRTPDKKAE